MKAVALILVSALMGAGGVVVNDEMQEAKAQEILIAEITADIEIANLELDVMMEQVGELERQFQVGVVGEEELLAARVVLGQAEFHLATLQMDLEEVRSSGKKPHNQVSAPLVDRRDFVTERLALQESVAAAGWELARIRFARVQDLVDAGAISDRELNQATLALQEAESQVERIQVRLNLRQRFLEEGMEGGAAELELEILETQLQIGVAERAMDEAVNRYSRVEELVLAGTAHESELRQARVQLSQMEIELTRLQRRLAILRRGGLTPGTP